jgi:hypothetical protein
VDKDAAHLDLLLNYLIEILEELPNIIALAVEEGIDDVLDAHLRVVELVHAECRSDDYISAFLPVMIF